jgi:RNA polymerase primary sigma factor
VGEFVEDERASDTPGEVLREIESEGLQEAIELLPGRHRRVLIRRYGLDDQGPATLAELGEDLRISRERVRQLQREAERMLKGGEYGQVFGSAAASTLSRLPSSMVAINLRIMTLFTSDTVLLPA